MRHLPVLALGTVALIGLATATVIAIGIIAVEDALGVNSPSSLKRYQG